MVTVTGDQSFIRNLNRSIVLKLLRFESPLTRAEISRRTGLTKATVSAIVAHLIKTKYVIETGQAQSSRVGRPAVPLAFNPHAGFAMGMDFGVDYYKVVVTDLAAHVVKLHECTNLTTDTADNAIVQITTTLKRVMQQVPSSPLGFLGAGIAIPGLVDAEHGIILNAPNLMWKNVEMQAALQNNLHMPVFIDNEANAGAQGEQLFGAGQGASNMIFVSLGRGIGTGIIVNNRLLRGEAGIAGEFGHMTIDLNGPVCSCGNHGCLETFASEASVTANYRRLTGESLLFRDIVERMVSGDRCATECVENAAHHLGIGVVSLVNALNPALILVGTRFPAINPLILSGIEKSIKERSFISSYSPPRVIASLFGPLSCAIGAASMVLQKHFSASAKSES